VLALTVALGVQNSHKCAELLIAAGATLQMSVDRRPRFFTISASRREFSDAIHPFPAGEAVNAIRVVGKHIGKQFKDARLGSIWHVDPFRCWLVVVDILLDFQMY
jgi:hypothetical protein